MLAQVLVLAVVASLLCAALLRARLQPALNTARVRDRVADDLAAQGAVNRVVEVWSRAGACGSDGALGVQCAGSGCGCTCVVLPFARGGYAVQVTSLPAGPGQSCALQATRM